MFNFGTMIMKHWLHLSTPYNYMYTVYYLCKSFYSINSVWDFKNVLWNLTTMNIYEPGHLILEKLTSLRFSSIAILNESPKVFWTICIKFVQGPQKDIEFSKASSFVMASHRVLSSWHIYRSNNLFNSCSDVSWRGCLNCLAVTVKVISLQLAAWCLLLADC